MTHPNDFSTKCHHTDSDGEVVTSTKKESVKLWKACSSKSCGQYLLNDRWFSHRCRKGCCIWIGEFTYSHIRFRLSVAHVLHEHIAVDVECALHSRPDVIRFNLSIAVEHMTVELTILRQVNYLFLFALGLVRDEFALPRWQFSAPVDDGADPGAPESSGASSRFRSSIRTRVCWHHLCPISTWTARLWGSNAVFQLVDEVIVIPLIHSVVVGFLVCHLVRLDLLLLVCVIFRSDRLVDEVIVVPLVLFVEEEEDFLVHHDVRLVLLLLLHFNVVAPVLILILNLVGAHEVLIPEVVQRRNA